MGVLSVRPPENCILHGLDFALNVIDEGGFCSGVRP